MVTERKRLKFQKDYLYLNRNTIMDHHPKYIHDNLLKYFNVTDLHQYPDLWKTYEILSNYLNVSTDQLLITRGVEGAIKQVFDTLDLNNQTIGITSPGYAMYHVYAKNKNVNIISITGTKPQYNITLQQIKNIVPSIKVLFIDNPKSHLPHYFTHDELYNIISYCKKHNVLVFLDEVYAEWETDSYLQNLYKHDNLIISRSFSKIAFPSIKSGWLVTNKKLKHRLESNRNSYEIDYFACKTIEFIIDNIEYIESIKSTLLSTKKRWYKKLLKSKKFKVYDSKNYVLRLYSDNENIINETYNRLYKQKIVVGIVDKFNLVFSVTNNKQIEKIFFKEING
jgi:histidinol-phosphate/aromatic aminotransferase/cobyric acid decarboxylase-like protein